MFFSRRREEEDDNKNDEKITVGQKNIAYYITISRATCEDEYDGDGPRTVQTTTIRPVDVHVRRRGHELRMDGRWIDAAQCKTVA